MWSRVAGRKAGVFGGRIRIGPVFGTPNEANEDRALRVVRTNRLRA
jgi:hypothetical protein